MYCLGFQYKLLSFNTEHAKSMFLKKKSPYTAAKINGVTAQLTIKGRFTHSMPFPRRAHAVLLPCRAAKGLECVLAI